MFLSKKSEGMWQKQGGKNLLYPVQSRKFRHSAGKNALTFCPGWDTIYPYGKRR